MARKSTPFADEALVAGAPWIDALRGDALACYREQGLPTARSEAWKFTNLRRLERIALRPARRKVRRWRKFPMVSRRWTALTARFS